MCYDFVNLFKKFVLDAGARHILKIHFNFDICGDDDDKRKRKNKIEFVEGVTGDCFS